MGKEKPYSTDVAPPRHGWGGRGRRDRVLGHRVAVETERQINPIKWGETNEPVDYELLELMNRKKDGANDE